mgnify:CR=1 FL=1
MLIKPAQGVPSYHPRVQQRAVRAALGDAPGSSCVLFCWQPALAVGRALCAAVLGSIAGLDQISSEESPWFA